VIGEYVGKIYLESKGRPRYAVEERLSHQPDPRIDLIPARLTEERHPG
jgi:hypothetical protein